MLVCISGVGCILFLLILYHRALTMGGPVDRQDGFQCHDVLMTRLPHQSVLGCISKLRPAVTKPGSKVNDDGPVIELTVPL